jgi:hypothetical protein
MTEAEAIEALRFHSGHHEDIDNPRWRYGFLGSLRPYLGKLHDDNYHEVMAAVATLARVHSGEHGARFPHEAHAALWGIVHLGRVWGVQAGGMLRSNNLINAKDIDVLDIWLSTISYAVFLGLEGSLNEVDLDYEPPPRWSAVWEALGEPPPTNR